MGVSSWLYGLGVAGMSAFARTLFGSASFAGAVSSGARRVAEARGYVDRGVNGLLGLLSLPSKADHNRLLAKVEVLQGSLVNLNIKMDRLLAAGLRPQREPPGSSGMPDPDPAES